jgi:hypothetical protein
MVQMSTSSALNLLLVMFASEVELASHHDRLGPEYLTISLAFDLVPKKARDLRAPNHTRSLEYLKYVYCTVSNRIDSDGSDPGDQRGSTELRGWCL